MFADGLILFDFYLSGSLLSTIYSYLICPLKVTQVFLHVISLE